MSIYVNYVNWYVNVSQLTYGNLQAGPLVVLRIKDPLDLILGSPKYWFKPSPYLRKWPYCTMSESANPHEERMPFEWNHRYERIWTNQFKGKNMTNRLKKTKNTFFWFFREIDDFWRQPDSAFSIFQQNRKSCFATTPCRQNQDVLSKSMVFMSFSKAI